MEALTGTTTKSKMEGSCAFISLSHPFLSLAEKLSLVSLIQSHNAYTHSAGRYTISELQRRPAVGDGVRFQTLWFPFKCYHLIEKHTSLVGCTWKLFMEGFNDVDIHAQGNSILLPTEGIIDSPTGRME